MVIPCSCTHNALAGSISVNSHGSDYREFALPQKRAGKTAVAYAAYCTYAASRNPRLAGSYRAQVRPQHDQTLVLQHRTGVGREREEGR